MAQSRSKYCCLVIEYSSFLTFVFYLFGFTLFCFDIFLTLFRSNIENALINFNSTNCLILDDKMDIRITKPLIELTFAFLVYFLLFILLLFYQFLGNSHWEYAIQLDSDGRFFELYNHVISSYPKCPLSDYDVVSAHFCPYKSFLPTRHWIFQPEAARQSTRNKFIQVAMMWFCSAIQISILYFAPCFLQMKISYSNYDFMAFAYSFYTISFSCCLWLITIISTIMEWKIERFYKYFEQSIYTFLTFNLKIGCFNANSFLNSIGRNGISYLVRMGDVSGTAKLHYLLMVLISEYYRMNDLPFPFEETWDNFENDFLEYIHTGKKRSGDTSLLDSILNSSTYEHFDDLEAQKQIIETES
uniref:Gustatory receptor n=1 Tax=Panagrolaimus sp. PS1159 TaxID=55785 RepID=A0AC35F1A3_9BILA